MVKRKANKNIGEKITILEEIKASLSRDSLTHKRHMKHSHLLFVVTIQFVKIHQFS